MSGGVLRHSIVALAALLATGSHAYGLRCRPLGGVLQAPTSACAPRLPTVAPLLQTSRSALRMSEESAEQLPPAEQPSAGEPASPLGRFRAWLSKWAKFDKDQIKKLGVDAFFTYGCVSNLNVGFTVALAWATFSKASGLSPLAAGQWRGFLATYTGIYLSLGSILRPFRMALAVSCTPLYGRAVGGIRDRLPFRESRPKLNRTLALIVVSLLVNVAGTCGLIVAGAWFAGLVTGVPAFPPGWSLGRFGPGAVAA